MIIGGNVKSLLKWALILTILIMGLNACKSSGLGKKAGAKGSIDLKTEKDSVSYAIGLSIGKNLKQNMIDVDYKVFLQAVKDAADTSKIALTDAQAQDVLTKFQQNLAVKQEAQRKTDGVKNQKEGEEFLAKNKTQTGVTVLPTGEQYQVLKQGNGPIPKATDTVKCHYKGTLLNGKEFDSSYKRNQPAEFPVNGVIKGWQDVLVKMPVGSKWKVVIPSALAYGEQGAGTDIAPNSVLVFEIELLEIVKK